MRIAHLLTTGALALAIPALAQTSTAPVGRTPAPAATPTPSATPMSPTPSMPMATTPATPADGTAPAASGVQQTTPSGAPTPGATMADPAAATAPIGPSVGATVYGASGNSVGTIKAMDSQFVTLTTEKGDVRLPVAGVGPGLKGPVIGLTAEQLDAAVTQAQAAQPAPAAATTETKTTTTTKTKKGRR